MRENCGVMKQKVLLKLVCSLWIDDGRSQCGINTMFNTGTVIGVSANILGLISRNVPSFSWGGAWIYHLYHQKKHLKRQD
jgi:hypothetical protein